MSRKSHAITGKGAVLSKGRPRREMVANIKNVPIVQPGRIRWSRQTSANPIKGLTFDKMSRQLESFALGYLVAAAPICMSGVSKT